jgi:hypothetical protein
VVSPSIVARADQLEVDDLDRGNDEVKVDFLAVQLIHTALVNSDVGT